MTDSDEDAPESADPITAAKAAAELVTPRVGTRRTQARDPRGYFGIGIERPKSADNIGTLWRSAYCLGAAFVFTIGHRYRKQASDVPVTWRHIPLLEFTSTEDFLAHRPYSCELVGVELCEGAKPLETFTHPQRAIYLLGPEDGSLSGEALGKCQSVVQFTSRFCLNVAAAGTVVMYDRQTKAQSHA